MVTIIFESHRTTTDNEAYLASGLFDVELSKLGIKQAKELGKRYENDHFDAFFCSDLKRSYKTAEIAFEKRGVKIIKDRELRECDYGDFTSHPRNIVDAEKTKRIKIPFPNGESYEQTSNRVKKFLQELLQKYDNKKVMIIGHRATQYGLEHWINKVPLKKAITSSWKWQTGWIYYLKEI